MRHGALNAPSIDMDIRSERYHLPGHKEFETLEMFAGGLVITGANCLFNVMLKYTILIYKF